MSFPVWLVGTGTVLSPTGVADTVSPMLSCGSCSGLEYFSHTCVFPLVLSTLLPSNPLQVSGGLCLSALTPLWYSLQGILPAYAHLNSQLLNLDRLQVSNSSPHPLPGAGNSRQKAGAIVGLTYLGFHLSGIIAWLSSLDTVDFIYFVYFFFQLLQMRE